MPPKKKIAADDDAPLSARFGRVKNTLKMGLVGLPNVGKSSLFNLLTQQSVAAENYPFCTIDPSEAKCPVPDQRFQYLVDLWKPPSVIPAHLSVWDIAGIIKGASEVRATWMVLRSLYVLSCYNAFCCALFCGCCKKEYFYISKLSLTLLITVFVD